MRLDVAHVGAWVGVLVAAYLLGSIPFSWLVVRWRTGQDVRRVGSGNVGATNAMRAAGRAAGALALLLDIGKGIATVLVVRALGAPPLLEAAAATLAVIGHMYPVWLRFEGGKGVATAAGALGALAPLAALAAVVVFVVVVLLTRYVSLGSIVALLSFPVAVLLLSRWGQAPHDPSFLGCSAMIPALSVWKHRGNVRRLLAGTERKLGEKRRPDGRGAAPSPEETTAARKEDAVPGERMQR